MILERTDPEMLLEDLTDAEVNAFVQMRRAEGAGLYGINRALAVWRGMFERARKKWKQRTQVIDWADFMNPEEQRTRWLTQEEVMRLLSYLPSHIALAVEWSVATGTREDETFSLDWSTVYLDRGYARVRAKGSRQHTVWLSEAALRVPRVPRARAEAKGLMAATGGSCLSGAWRWPGLKISAGTTYGTRTRLGCVRPGHPWKSSSVAWVMPPFPLAPAMPM